MLNITSIIYYFILYSVITKRYLVPRFWTSFFITLYKILKPSWQLIYKQHISPNHKSCVILIYFCNVHLKRAIINMLIKKNCRECSLITRNLSTIFPLTVFRVSWYALNFSLQMLFYPFFFIHCLYLNHHVLSGL